MFKFSIALVSVMFSINVLAAESCIPVNDQKIVIGCTSDCDKPIKRAIKNIAKKRGYSVEIIDMYSENISEDLSSLDGMVIPGGVDVDPKHYKFAVEKDLREKIERLDYLVNYTKDGQRRDPFELKTLREYFQTKDNSTLPLLAICRGMQILSVSQGIPLYIDIKKELGIKNRRNLNDRIYIQDRGSLIGRVLQFDNFLGAKNHHQGLRVDYFKKYQKERWPEISITSTSNNGLIAESIEFKNRPIIATQFHPESDRGVEKDRIFSWMLEKSCEKSNLKQFVPNSPSL